MTPKNVAIAGATGAVGAEFMSVLEKRNFPIKNIKFLASARSVGKKITFKGEEFPVEEMTKDSFKGVDIALFSAGASRSRDFAEAVVDAGCVMVDNSSAFRMDPTVPLVVPEINPEDVKWHKGIIANPNCSTIIMLMAVYPIYKLSRVKRIIVSTYQAASGAGAKAMEELKLQAADFLAGRPVKKEVLPHQIAFNLFSHNTKIGEDGYNEEEVKMIKESNKILHDADLKITATCVRVPVLRAHSESVSLETERKLELDEIRKAIAAFPGCQVVDDRDANYFPMPLDASGKDDCLVGRIRYDKALDNGIALFVCGDQLLKGAALNAVQIAELL
jgi:aspartate-semialdehyde dehydrogenase